MRWYGNFCSVAFVFRSAGIASTDVGSITVFSRSGDLLNGYVVVAEITFDKINEACECLLLHFQWFQYSTVQYSTVQYSTLTRAFVNISIIYILKPRCMTWKTFKSYKLNNYLVETKNRKYLENKNEKNASSYNCTDVHFLISLKTIASNFLHCSELLLLLLSSDTYRDENVINN